MLTPAALRRVLPGSPEVRPAGATGVPRWTEKKSWTKIRHTIPDSCVLRTFLRYVLRILFSLAFLIFIIVWVHRKTHAIPRGLSRDANVRYNINYCYVKYFGTR